MKKVLTAILLSLLISACATAPETIYTCSQVIIPEHKNLDALTPEQVAQLPDEIHQKMENIRAALIANIKQLEHNINVHNRNCALPEPDT